MGWLPHRPVDLLLCPTFGNVTEQEIKTTVSGCLLFAMPTSDVVFDRDSDLTSCCVLGQRVIEHILESLRRIGFSASCEETRRSPWIW